MDNIQKLIDHSGFSQKPSHVHFKDPALRAWREAYDRKIQNPQPSDFGIKPRKGLRVEYNKMD